MSENSEKEHEVSRRLAVLDFSDLRGKIFQEENTIAYCAKRNHPLRVFLRNLMLFPFLAWIYYSHSYAEYYPLREAHLPVWLRNLSPRARRFYRRHGKHIVRLKAEAEVFDDACQRIWKSQFLQDDFAAWTQVWEGMRRRHQHLKPRLDRLLESLQRLLSLEELEVEIGPRATRLLEAEQALQYALPAGNPTLTQELDALAAIEAERNDIVERSRLLDEP